MVVSLHQVLGCRGLDGEEVVNVGGHWERKERKPYQCSQQACHEEPLADSILCIFHCRLPTVDACHEYLAPKGFCFNMFEMPREEFDY